MIKSPGKLKKNRFDQLKAISEYEEKRLKALGAIYFDDVEGMDNDDEYEADDEEYEDLEEELAAEFLDFMA